VCTAEAQLRIAENLSYSQFPKLSPTPETAAAADEAHVKSATDATAADYLYSS